MLFILLFFRLKYDGFWRHRVIYWPIDFCVKSFYHITTLSATWSSNPFIPLTFVPSTVPSITTLMQLLCLIRHPSFQCLIRHSCFPLMRVLHMFCLRILWNISSFLTPCFREIVCNFLQQHMLKAKFYYIIKLLLLVLIWTSNYSPPASCLKIFWYFIAS